MQIGGLQHGVSCREAHVQQQQVCTRLLPACLPARAAPPCRTCAEPHPQARKDVPPAGLNHPGSLDQVAGAQGPLPSCSLVASGLKEVKRGKEKCLARRPCRPSKEGWPNPELLSASFTVPIPARPGAPQCCTDVVSTMRRMCYLGGATCSSGPQHTFVLCLVPHTHTMPCAH